MLPTFSENQYCSVKHKLLSCCYRVMELGYSIGSNHGVDWKDFSWEAFSNAVSPLGAFLLVDQPGPLRETLQYQNEDWDALEQIVAADCLDISADFVAGFCDGYANVNDKWRAILALSLNCNNEIPFYLPKNVVSNEEDFRLGVKLGKYFAKKFLWT